MSIARCTLTLPVFILVIQAILGEWHYDWQRVLQSDLGLTEAGFRTLLSRRYEMHEGAHLDENDRKPAQVLKKKFDLETSDLN